jgi:magnesium-transporting ATPase (P-type)
MKVFIGILVRYGVSPALGYVADTYRRTGEIPFSSATKWMATMCTEPGKPDSQAVTYMKGMIDVVLEKRCVG